MIIPRGFDHSEGVRSFRGVLIASDALLTVSNVLLRCSGHSGESSERVQRDFREFREIPLGSDGSQRLRIVPMGSSVIQQYAREFRNTSEWFRRIPWEFQWVMRDSGRFRMVTATSVQILGNYDVLQRLLKDSNIFRLGSSGF